MRNLINTGGVLLSLTMAIIILRPARTEEKLNFYKPDDSGFEWNSVNLSDIDNAFISLTSSKKYVTMYIDPNIYISWDNIKDPIVKTYVEKFYKVARQEQAKHGVLSSIKLAQGIIESASGTSKLAVKSNNHFGIKCKDCMRGKSKGHKLCLNYHDDSAKDIFRGFNSSTESYRYHSLFIINQKGRYHKLLNHELDYRAWAYGLKNAGYATAPHYAQTLIEVIEKYELYKADH